MNDKQPSPNKRKLRGVGFCDELFCPGERFHPMRRDDKSLPFWSFQDNLSLQTAISFDRGHIENWNQPGYLVHVCLCNATQIKPRPLSFVVVSWLAHRVDWCRRLAENPIMGVDRYRLIPRQRGKDFVSSSIQRLHFWSPFSCHHKPLIACFKRGFTIHRPCFLIRLLN